MLAMNNDDSIEKINAYWSIALKQYENKVRRANRKRNVAAITDFAKNLFSVIGRNKGMRYDISGSPRAGTANSIYEEAQERYNKALLDYKGKIASLALNPAQHKKEQDKSSFSYMSNPLIDMPQRMFNFNLSQEKETSVPAIDYTGIQQHDNILSKIKNYKYSEWYSNKN